MNTSEFAQIRKIFRRWIRHVIYTFTALDWAKNRQSWYFANGYNKEFHFPMGIIFINLQI